MSGRVVDWRQIVHEATPISRTDLDQIGERIKHMNIVLSVEGYLLMTKGFQIRANDSSSAITYFTMAITKFEQDLNSNTYSKVTLRNCARCLVALEEEECHLRDSKIRCVSVCYSMLW